MYNIDKLVKIGTKKLAKNYKKDLVCVILEPDVEPYHWTTIGCVKPGDIPLKFKISIKQNFSDADFMPETLGKVLIRKGHVHFYDTYPFAGGPYRVKDYKNPGYRKRAEIIVENINQLLGYDGRSVFDKQSSDGLMQLLL